MNLKAQPELPEELFARKLPVLTRLGHRNPKASAATAIGLAHTFFTVHHLECSTTYSPYSLHCSSFFWFNEFYIKDPKR